ncbi:hypothetical protein ACKGJO_00960 [Gracilimonas sp. Q87]|uniref:hypothetical protein n=1 Tax=Gracilimonas sp. Q87 TaxID=3384766 RepID=UPI003983EE30
MYDPFKKGSFVSTEVLIRGDKHETDETLKHDLNYLISEKCTFFISSDENILKLKNHLHSSSFSRHNYNEILDDRFIPVENLKNYDSDVFEKLLPYEEPGVLILPDYSKFDSNLCIKLYELVYNHPYPIYLRILEKESDFATTDSFKFATDKKKSNKVPAKIPDETKGKYYHNFLTDPQTKFYKQIM